MISIQQAGLEILGNNPGKLYFFCGKEFGVKQKYIDHLVELFGVEEDVESLTRLFASFKRKSLLALTPKLYVCRYDYEFVKQFDAKKADSLNVDLIDGCVVALYDDEKSFKKLDKLFPNNVVRFDEVSSQFTEKYLKSDYPSLDERYVHLAAENCFGGYGHAKVVCGQMNCISNSLNLVEDEDLLLTFGLSKSFTEDQMMKRAAARSFSGVVKVVDSYEGDLNHLINGLCHVSIELDKAMDSRAETPYSKYVKMWTREDVYNFFEQAYCKTLELRSGLGSSAYDALTYLASLLKFKSIPSVEQTSWKW